MAKEIFVSVPHTLGREEAKRRVADALERARSGFAESIVAGDVAWKDNHATVSVAALGQTINADVDVEAEEVRVRVQLPWLLAGLSSTISDRLKQIGGATLRLGHDTKPSPGSPPRPS
ncbi:MAG TPA: polyhydroxyalkanoic acid system family protein [Beijerinckiaceae bacterium]|jgi:hypothetical protein